MYPSITSSNSIHDDAGTLSSYEAPTALQLSKPEPRPPRSDLERTQIHIQNRRHEFLQKHPSYLEAKDHELADPVLYERLVKRFQTAAERSAQVKSQGYGRTLEADLLRGENRLAQLPRSQRAQAQARPKNEGFEQDWDRPAADKTDGINLWHTFLAHRFVQGEDEDFDYTAVDTNDEYDSLAREDAEEAWYDDEEPGTASDVADCTVKSPQQGNTGIQDF